MVKIEVDLNIKKDCLNHKGEKMDYYNEERKELSKVFSGEDFKY